MQLDGHPTFDSTNNAMLPPQMSKLFEQTEKQTTSHMTNATCNDVLRTACVSVCAWLLLTFIQRMLIKQINELLDVSRNPGSFCGRKGHAATTTLN